MTKRTIILLLFCIGILPSQLISMSKKDFFKKSTIKNFIANLYESMTARVLFIIVGKIVHQEIADYHQKKELKKRKALSNRLQESERLQQQEEQAQLMQQLRAQYELDTSRSQG